MGSSGAEVLELKKKLVELGFLNVGVLASKDAQIYDETLESVVRAFQAKKGLDADGICGPQTQATLKEAGWQLGDRHLYLASPMLRGDDVAALQKLLGQLGFNAGREDGIFGPDTEQALKDFQKNNDLMEDKICGRDTLLALHQISRRARGENVASVKDRERFRIRREPHKINDSDIDSSEVSKITLTICQLLSIEEKNEDSNSKDVLNEIDILNSLTENIMEELHKQEICKVETNRSQNPSDLAQFANGKKADVCLALKISPTSNFEANYFSTGTYESAGGRYLAELLTQNIPQAFPLTKIKKPQGMRTSILRETRMWSVFCTLGGIEEVKGYRQKLSKVFAKTLKSWIND